MRAGKKIKGMNRNRIKWAVYLFILFFFTAGLIFTDYSFREIYLGRRENKVLSILPRGSAYRIWCLGQRGTLPRYFILAKFKQKKNSMEVFIAGGKITLKLPRFGK
ncbi:MAG: hypothetical protein ACM3WV_05650 [Bacillota bacterium]